MILPSSAGRSLLLRRPPAQHPSPLRRLRAPQIRKSTSSSTSSPPSKPHAGKSDASPGKPQSRNSSSNAGHVSSRPHPPAERTIPGPSWLWLEPLHIPLRHYTRLHKRRPYIVQLCSSLLIYLLGDLSAQHIASSSADPSSPSPYNPHQTARALCIGAISSIPSYRWFLWLGNQWNTLSKPVSIGLKVVVNQVVFTPVFNTYFFGMQMLLSGAGWDEGGRVRWRDIGDRLQETVPRSWRNSWKVWPAVTAVSFLWIRVELRSVFAGVIAIGWQTYLSLLNARAAKAQAASTSMQPAKETDHREGKSRPVPAQA